MYQQSEELDRQPFCYLTTRGRVSGQDHTIEIWFALQGTTLFMLSGSGARADWVRNLVQLPEVRVRIATTQLTGRARIVTDSDEDALARRLVLGKYQPHEQENLTEWGRTALPVAVDLNGQ